MSLSFPQYHLLASQLSAVLKGTLIQSCRGVEGDKRFVVSFSTPSQIDHELLVSLYFPFIRFHLIRKKIHLVNTPFTQSLSKILVGGAVESFELLNEDRILKVGILQGEKRYSLVVELFPKHPNLYLLNQKKEILESFYPSENKTYILPLNKNSPLGLTDCLEGLSSEQLEELFIKKEQEALFNQKKHQLESWIKQQFKNAQRLQKRFTEELLRCSKWQNLQHEGTLLQANFFQLKKGLKEITVHDWENQDQEMNILLNPLLTPKEEVACRFKLSKKMKRGLEPLEKRLKQSQQEVSRWDFSLSQMTSVIDWKTLEKLEKDVHFPKESSSKPLKKSIEPFFYTFYSASGLRILVGKSAKNNEKLTFQLASGRDWWLHVKDFSGSHVVIKISKGQEPDEEALLDAMQLALFYSKAKNQGGADICVTQCKYVSRLKSAIGQVQISKQKNRYIKNDSKRLVCIKERSSKAVEEKEKKEKN